jgi:phytoene dehydrogenase-like protein
MGADVIVIGAGYSGLTAAAILAHNGLEVSVLEATSHLGGRSTYDRKDGFLVDYGVHMTRYGHQGHAAAALREIGYEIDFISPGEAALFDDGKFAPMPTGVGTFLGSRTLSWADKIIIGHGVRRLLVSSPDKLADVPLSEAIPGSGRQEVRRFYQVLSGMGLVAPDIDRASAGEFVRFLRHAMRAREKAAYPRGGTSQIIEALSSKVRESGDIATSSRVRTLDVVNGRVKAARVQEAEHEARAVVAAVPAQKVPGLVGEALDDGVKKRCALVPTAGISIDLCLDRVVSDLEGFVIAADPVILGHFTSNIDPETAPRGKQLGTFIYVMPAESMEDRGTVEAAEKRFMATLEEMFPGILDRVEWQRVLHMRMVDGFEPRVGQTPKDRPDTQVPGIDNLFLAGDCISTRGMGGDVAFTSGVAAARAVMEYLK